jgi:hypothetical protein
MVSIGRIIGIYLFVRASRTYYPIVIIILQNAFIVNANQRLCYVFFYDIFHIKRSSLRLFLCPDSYIVYGVVVKKSYFRNAHTDYLF